MRRWIVFNAIGAIGCAVQVAVLAALLSAGVHYVAATAAAVEAALLQNFVLHERWTWRDRPGGVRARFGRAVRFHALNGLVSLVGNLALMRVLVEGLGAPAIPANLAAVVICSGVNFAAAHMLVWRV